MKKRTKQKIKKLIPKIYFRALYIVIPLFLIVHAIDNFTQLHNGAPMNEVDGYKYQPVFSELLVIIVSAAFLLLILKVLTKISPIPFILTCIATFGLIGWFGYWAYEYTLQDPAEGFLGLGITLGVVSILIAAGLWYESHQRRNRKKRNKKADA